MNINIGKAVLYQITGLERNHRTEIFENIDIEKSGCRNCPWYNASLSTSVSEKLLSDITSHCSSCSSRYTGKSIYVNEKNRYGSKPRLCRNSILLFCLLHGCSPTASGYINSVPLYELAERLGCDTKTIRNNLKNLSSAGYIYSDIYNGYANIVLLDYNSYFLNADKGGRGYVKIDDSILSSLISIKSTVGLRIIIRQLLSSDQNREQIRTYREISYSLPGYCRRNIIQKALEKVHDIFDITVTDSCIKFSLLSKCDVKNSYNRFIQEYYSYYDDIFKNIDNIVMELQDMSNSSCIPDKYRSFFYRNDELIKKPVFFPLTGRNDAILSLAKLTYSYSREIVTESLAAVYHYMCTEPKLIDIGLYVSRYIRSRGLIDGTVSNPDFKNLKKGKNLTATA